MFVEGFLIGSNMPVTSAPIEQEQPCNISPTVGEEYVSPAFGDADATCKISIAQIRDNMSSDLWYLERVPV
jgi:hypothetical protein